MPLARGYLQAVTELLTAFVQGLEEKTGEAELDLAQLDRQVNEAAGQLLAEVDLLPDSPLATALAWGWRPLRWPDLWQRCRRAQGLARRLAHLSRGRLLAWQQLSTYEELLPFYRELPPRILVSHRPEEMALVTLRRFELG